jgi:putative radical SAM enzyme (TIGR03279 family)
MVKITSVEKGSRAEKSGILAGDILITINENQINDVLDYRFYLTERHVEIGLSRDGEEYSVSIKKGEYDDIGLEFETPLMDKKHSCKNKCIFCFIDQNPEGLRESLYFKDDDSRLSFIHGNYVTLTNMTQQDVDRIIKMRMSPINISVHTTNPELRVKMMKNKHSGEVLKYLNDFASAGLSMCGQIVLCRGVNDGEELLRSLNDLAALYPAMSSVAIVPAGLTKFREKLYPLTDFTPLEAGNIIDMINSVGEEHKAKHGTRLFYAADEFYLKAGREIPSAEYYEDYSQIENGVGMLRSCQDEFGMALDDAAELLSDRDKKRTVSLVTGVAAYPMIKEQIDKLCKICPNLNVNIYEIKNYFFGESITVSGLLTGKDMYEQLKDKPLGEELLIPHNCLRHGEEVFLCGMTVSELSEKLSVPVRTSGQDGYELCEAILGRSI